jgi:hypothetical protein
MNADEAIGQLAHKLGIELTLDVRRVCAVVFDDRLTVEFEAPASLAEVLMMTCKVASRVQADQREEVYALLLQANLFGRGTAGAVLAVDSKREEIVLQRALHLGQADFQDLLNALESLLQFGQAWVDRLRPISSALTRRDEGSLSAYSAMLKV